MTVTIPKRAFGGAACKARRGFGGRASGAG